MKMEGNDEESTSNNSTPTRRPAFYNIISTKLLARRSKNVEAPIPTKRARIEGSATNEDRDKPVSMVETISTKVDTFKRKSPILHMPTEVLQRILCHLSYEELACTTRLINRRFRFLVHDLLNKAFITLEPRLLFLQEMVRESIEHSSADMERRCLCKVLNVIEILMLHYTLLKATIWRFITKKYDPAHWCMHGGLILDMYNAVMKDVVKTPQAVYLASIRKDYDMPKDVRTLKRLIRKFIIHFETISENDEEQVFSAGSKVLDILDCATYAQRKVTHLRYLHNNLYLQLTYYLTTGWFIAFDIKEDKPKTWKERQALFYMRLRRIVKNHTTMNLEYSQYKRECTYRPQSEEFIRKPESMTYSGYGHSTDKFYYYGLLNEGAYFIRFRMEPAMDEDQLDEQVEVNEAVDVSPEMPFSGLYISVVLRCPLQMAPYKILKELEQKHEYPYTTWQGKRRPKGKYFLKMEFNCPSASAIRLPPVHDVTFYQER